jgi:FkbM family methyltransferase
MTLRNALPRFARYARRHGVGEAVRASYARVAIRAAYESASQKDRALRTYARMRGRDPRSIVYRMPACGTAQRLLARAGTTDWLVFQEIFAQGAYDVFLPGDDPRFIVDCGANVGYASALFLSRFPKARGIAVEPDAGNFEMLCRNLAQFGDRMTIVQSAVWSHATGLHIMRSVEGECEFAVRECVDGETPDVIAVDMNDLLARSPSGTIDLLKMDIEGGETVVFGDRPEQWLSRVSMCVIELHDDEARTVFFRAAGDFDVVERGRIAMARRRPVGA